MMNWVQFTRWLSDNHMATFIFLWLFPLLFSSSHSCGISHIFFSIALTFTAHLSSEFSSAFRLSFLIGLIIVWFFMSFLELLKSCPEKNTGLGSKHVAE